MSDGRGAARATFNSYHAHFRQPWMPVIGITDPIAKSENGTSFQAAGEHSERAHAPLDLQVQPAENRGVSARQEKNGVRTGHMGNRPDWGHGLQNRPATSTPDPAVALLHLELRKPRTHARTREAFAGLGSIPCSVLRADERVVFFVEETRG